jgi:hypothetical protein
VGSVRTRRRSGYPPTTLNQASAASLFARSRRVLSSFERSFAVRSQLHAPIITCARVACTGMRAAPRGDLNQASAASLLARLLRVLTRAHFCSRRACDPTEPGPAACRMAAGCWNITPPHAWAVEGSARVICFAHRWRISRTRCVLRALASRCSRCAPLAGHSETDISRHTQAQVDPDLERSLPCSRLRIMVSRWRG